jgi:lysophospholipase L1-like esterase
MLTRRSGLRGLIAVAGSFALAAFRPAKTPDWQGADEPEVPQPKAGPGRFREFQERAAQDNGAVAFVGDSIIQGWGEIGPYFPGLRCANLGINGDTSRGVAARLARDVLALNPRALVLMIGTNDLAGGADPGAVADTIQTIVRSFRNSFSAAPIFICLVPPRHYSALATRERIQALNLGLSAAARRVPRIYVVNTWALFKAPGDNANLALLPDGLHPGPAGYAAWASLLRSRFRTAGLR